MTSNEEDRGASRLATIVRVTFIFGGLLPWLLPFARRALALGWLGVMLDRLFLPFCHRLADRTLLLAGMPMPLCSRCAGICAGVALGAFFARPRWTRRRFHPFVAFAVALMLLDVFTQDAGLHPSWHPSRIATGVVLGYVVAASCVVALCRTANEGDIFAER